MSEWSNPQGTHIEGYVICISEAFLAVNGGETVVGPRRVGGKEGRKEGQREVIYYIPIDSSNEKRTSFPFSRRSFILLPIHLKPGNVS